MSFENEIIQIDVYDGHHMYVFKNDTIVSRFLMNNKIWEPHIHNWLTVNIKKGMRVIEGGSNIGAHSLHIARLIDTDGILFCFEANPDFARVLQKNIDFNYYQARAKVISQGLWSTETTKIYHQLHDNYGGSSFFYGEESPQNTRMEVSCVAADQIIGDQKIDFIKLDIEGSEYQALLGMQKILQTPPEYIMLEHSSLSNAALFSFISNHGYAPYLFDGTHLSSQEIFDNIPKTRGTTDIICKRR